MTITKETAKELGRKGGKTAAANRRAGIDALLQFEMQGGAQHMLAIREKQLRGEKLTDAEEGFKKDYKDLMEYHTPKLARQELTGKDGKELPAPILAGVLKKKGK